AARHDDRLRRDGELPAVREPAADLRRALSAGSDRLGQALAEDPHGARELALGAGQDVVERRELLAVGTADVAVARAEAVLDVRVDDAVGSVQPELPDPGGHLVAARLEVLVVLLAVDREPLAEPLERLAEAIWVDAGIEPVRVVPALERPRRNVVTDGVVDDGAAAHALPLEHLEAGVGRHLQA